MNKCENCNNQLKLSVNGYVCINPNCTQYKSQIISDAFPIKKQILCQEQINER